MFTISLMFRLVYRCHASVATCSPSWLRCSFVNLFMFITACWYHVYGITSGILEFPGWSGVLGASDADPSGVVGLGVGLADAALGPLEVPELCEGCPYPFGVDSVGASTIWNPSTVCGCAR